MKYCVDCYHMDTCANEDGLFACLNSRKSGYNYVSARKVKCSAFGEAFQSKRGERERERYMSISREHGYYLVTIISKILSLGEDNIYLEEFANLKDNYMSVSAEYQSIVDEYEEKGPMLANLLFEDEEREIFASYLYAFFLENIIRFLNDGNKEEAVKEFVEMFDAVKERYLKPKREVISKIMIPSGY